MAERGDHVLSLASGRSIGYSVYGDPTGAVVLNCHGGLVSGHDVGPADQHAQELGLCILSPDRPGAGRTDRLPRYGMIPWVRSDVVPLLEYLGVERLGVMGWSEGGQYALAAAYELGPRVDRCAVIAGCLPVDDPSVYPELNPIDRTLITLAQRAPLLLRGYFRATAWLARASPRLLMQIAVRGLPKSELDAVAAQGAWLPTILSEGARQPRGGVDEYLAIRPPLGIRTRGHRGARLYLPGRRRRTRPCLVGSDARRPHSRCRTRGIPRGRSLHRPDAVEGDPRLSRQGRPGAGRFLTGDMGQN